MSLMKVTTVGGRLCESARSFSTSPPRQAKIAFAATAGIVSPLMSSKRLLLIGWDAADWKLIEPLLAAGEMPNLARLIASGVRGNIATIYPPLSPMLWTSIATGKRPYKHGIHGFSEPLPDGSGVRPITNLARQTKAVWNILNQNGYRSLVVGWWPSHPAEPINGVMVSNHFQQAVGTPEKSPPLPPGTVHPAALAETLAELRVNPMELEGEIIRMFVPEYDRVDQSKDKRIHSLGKIVAETMSVHAAATELLATQPWEFAAVYYDSIDHFGHGFMSYHPPRLPWVNEEDFAIYQHVMANAYRYHDAMLGALLKFADEKTSVVLMSDHGFHPDHLRPGYIPAEPAGPAVEHRHFGILCMKGPALRVNEPIYGASVLDVCPTILTLCGLPPGKDMDGKVLVNAFRETPPLEPIESWDNVAGEAGTHSPDTQLDPVASAQAFKQLVDLGYVAPPGENVQETVDETVRELKYNLARACRDGVRTGEAATILQELWTRWPKEHRFGIELIDCLTTLGQTKQRGEAVAELEWRMKRYRAEAKAELAKRAEQKKTQPQKENEPTGDAGQTREHFEERKLRELAQPQPQLLEWFKASQALLEGKPTEAREGLETLLAAPQIGWGLAQHVAAALAQMGESDLAQEILERALAVDSENPLVHARLAEVHFQAKRFEQAIAAATESLSLLYFQPVLHALLGQAFMETGRFAEAETELRVAVAQNRRHLVAHELLGKLYRQHLNRPTEAFVHEGLAQSLRMELATRRRTPPTTLVPIAPPPRMATDQIAEPFAREVDRAKIITVVSGLPRSGTSLMMQLLAAGGLEPLTDQQRAPDEDNPLGYFEFEKAQELAKDRSWVPQAQGKLVKIVAQLLPHLPRGEHYQVIFMQRDLREIVASQKAMLARLKRQGAELNEERLMETYAAQLRRIHDRLARSEEVRVLHVDYAGLLADPSANIERIIEFLGSDAFNRDAARAAVRPEMRRQKAER